MRVLLYFILMFKVRLILEEQKAASALTELRQLI